MDFLKKHYEKVILTVVLVGLAVASGFLVYKVQQVQQFLEEQDSKIKETKQKPLKPVNLSTNQAPLQRLTADIELKLSADHKVFNPVTWIQFPDKHLEKKPTGPGTFPLVVTAIYPLNLIIGYEGTNGSGDTLRYQFSITREYEASPSRRRKYSTLVNPSGPGAQNEIFILKAVHGPKESPESFDVEIKGDKSQATVKADQPLAHPTGLFMADFRSLDGRTFKAKRKDDKIPLDGENYNIVAINADDVNLGWKFNRQQLKYPQ